MWSIWAANLVFLETAVALRDAFALIGWPANLAAGTATCPWDNSNDTWVIVGLTLVPLAWPFPARYVVYQMEQLTSSWITERYVALATRALALWEFAPSHLDFWRGRLPAPALFVPCSAPAEFLERPLCVDDSIDVLFYGCHNDRREKIQRNIQASLPGRRIDFYLDFDLFGQNRDAVVATAKIVLNLHYYEHAALEVHRINYLLALGKCVVTEPSSDAYLDALYGTAAVFAPEPHLAHVLSRLLADDKTRRAIERNARHFALSLPVRTAHALLPAANDVLSRAQHHVQHQIPEDTRT
ncbi:hypothetical protein CTAYLR_005595 [Chrysophaeum taylorii]|uniref:Glycosyltransferase family 1 protein n=1 Tax=Chrysophaeum taylorii TaxID=2483200 RepID=A0AAD7U7V3_9STRA|nr:hypothetical protein CTAYLR_005595 [Chrysophaeum taylorii]